MEGVGIAGGRGAIRTYGHPSRGSGFREGSPEGKEMQKLPQTLFLREIMTLKKKLQRNAVCAKMFLKCCLSQ